MSAQPTYSLRDRRRTEIIDAARALVAEGGIEALTFGKLEKRLSFTRGVITYHFVNKDDIVTAVLHSAVEEIDVATLLDVARSATLHEQVSAVLNSKVQGFLNHPEATRILLAFWARPASDERSRAVNQRLFRTYRKQTKVLVEASGADLDVDAMSAFIVGTVVGVVTQVQLDPERVDAQSVVSIAVQCLMLRLSPQA